MFDPAGSLRSSPSPTLWCLLLGPACALMWTGLVAPGRFARRAARPAELERERLRTAIVGLAGVAGAGIALAVHAARLLSLPRGERYLLEHLGRGVAFPGAEGPLDLRMDTSSAWAIGLACLVATAAAGRAMRGDWRAWAWLEMALLGSLLALLADGAPTMAAGWAIAGAAAAWLGGWGDARRGARAAIRPAGAIVLALLASATLFWGLGGGWDDEHDPVDGPPELAVVHGAEGAGDATLTMPRPAETMLALDEARKSMLRAPVFGASLAAGRHVVRVEQGPTEGPSTPVTAGPGEDLVLVPVGPTVAIDAAAAQLSLPHGAGDGRRAWLERRTLPGGASVVATVLLALLGAVVTGTIDVPARPPPVAVMAPVLGLLPAFLMLRASFLVPSATRAGALVAAVGAMIVLDAARRGLARGGPGGARALVMATPPGVTLLALGLAGPTAGTIAWLVAGLGAAIALAVLDAPAEPEPRAEPRVEVALADGASLVHAMDRWVVGAVAGAAAAAGSIAAWLVARADEHVVATPAEAAARGLVRGGHAVRLHGVPIAGVAWTVVVATLAAAAALALSGRG